MNSTHHSNVLYVQGSDIGIHLGTGSITKCTIDNQDDDTRHDDNDDDGRGDTFTVVQYHDIVLGRANLEGKQTWSSQ